MYLPGINGANSEKVQRSRSSGYDSNAVVFKPQHSWYS